MASLKEINASVQEGNDDLQRLNQNFASWLSMQKSSGDDLEAAKEARTAKKKPSRGISRFVPRAPKAVSNLFGPKQLAVYTALIAPVLFDLFKKEIKDWLDSINPFNNPDKNKDITPPGVALSYKQFARTMTQARFSAKLNRVAIASAVKPPPPPPKGGFKYTFSTQRGLIAQKGPLRPGFVQSTAGKYVPLFTDKGLRNPNAQMIINRTAVIPNQGSRAPTAAGQSPRGTLNSTTSRLTLSQNISAYAKGNALAQNRQLPTAKYFQGLMNFLGQTKLGGPVKQVLKIIFSRPMQMLLLPAITGFQIYLIWTQQKFDGFQIVPKLNSEMLSLEGQLVQTGSILFGLFASRLGVIVGGAVGTFVLGAPVGTVLGAAVGGYIMYKLGARFIFFLYEFFKSDNKPQFIKDFLTGKLAQFQGNFAEFKKLFGKNKNLPIVNNPRNLSSFNQSIDYQVMATDSRDNINAGGAAAALAFNNQEIALTALENRFRNSKTGGTTNYLQNERKKLFGSIPTTSSFGQMVPTSMLPPEVAATLYKDNFYKNLQGTSTNSFTTGEPNTMLASTSGTMSFSEMGMMNMGANRGVSLTDQSVRTDTRLSMSIGGNENFHSRNSDMIDPWMPMAGTFRTA